MNQIASQPELAIRDIPFFRLALAPGWTIGAAIGPRGPGSRPAAILERQSSRIVRLVQLDARGRIVAAKDRARDVLLTGDGLLDSDGFLFAGTSRDNDDGRWVRDHLNVLITGPTGVGKELDILRPCPQRVPQRIQRLGASRGC